MTRSTDACSGSRALLRLTALIEEVLQDQGGGNLIDLLPPLLWLEPHIAEELLSGGTGQALVNEVNGQLQRLL